MKQIDWVEEFEKKKKRWYYRKYLKQNKIDFVCDLCKRDIVIEVELEKGVSDELVCICGKTYKLGAKLVNKWVGPYVKKRHTT